MFFSAQLLQPFHRFTSRNARKLRHSTIRPRKWSARLLSFETTEIRTNTTRSLPSNLPEPLRRFSPASSCPSQDCAPPANLSLRPGKLSRSILPWRNCSQPAAAFKLVPAACSDSRYRYLSLIAHFPLCLCASVVYFKLYLSQPAPLLYKNT
jgi:hypothetical protein